MMTQTTTGADMLNEAILLPGCPQIVVTRGWAFSWLVKLGYEAHTGRYNSADYLAFGRPATTEPLTDLTDPDVARFLNDVMAAELEN